MELAATQANEVGSAAGWAGEDAALRPNNEILKRLLRTWIQLCSNNSLYSDGLCYVRALEEVEVGVMVDVVRTGGRIRPG